ncbi:hypothetical protein SSP531S_02180 [Streptomyces spongiicola]|uniref:Uncharacterized protein n=1 Tax=Streptomyces spongiicola TaxID=1690221 RepID=A0A388SQX1_9ACTN|nr:hypothetical protein SSP531S_02180 [Streptomyces spongiicola]
MAAPVGADLAEPYVEPSHTDAARECRPRPLPDRVTARFEDVAAVRPLRRSRGAHHFSDRYRAATTGRHVCFESRPERDRLALTDFDPGVAGSASQPFRPHLHDGERERRHTPDYFIRRTDGSAVVVDVRTDERIRRPHFGDSRMRSSVRRPMLLIAGLLST